MARKYGLVGWEDVVLKTRKAPKKGGKDDFMRLAQGDNEVRLITNPHQYTIHTFKDEGDKGFGWRILCSGANSDECVLCDGSEELGITGSEPKERWFIGLIDRRYQSYKILDMSQQIFDQLQKMNRNNKIGDPQRFDINILVDKENGPASYYTLQNYNREALSEADMEIKKKSVDLNELQRKCTPLTPAEVVESVKRYRASRAGNKQMQGKPRQTQAPVQAPAPVQVQVQQQQQAPVQQAAAPVQQALPAEDDSFDYEFRPAKRG